MAKSTFLQLFVTTARECGKPTVPTAVTGQTGQLLEIVNWVADADSETQSRWFDWDFLHLGTWTTATVIGTAAVSAPSDLGVWDEDSFYLNYTAATHKQLPVMDYKTWRRDYRQGVKTNKKPDNVVILPDLSLKLEPPPDAVYTLSADYWKRPTKMTTNSATSPIPEEYERIIVARAKLFYAESYGANEILLSAQVEFDDLLDKLESKYLPSQKGRRRADPGMMVVIPE
jgi:hypothetical protein